MTIQGWVNIVNALGGPVLGASPGAPLNYVAPISIGRKGKSLNVGAPQYFVFPIRERYEGTQGAGSSGNPRALHTRLVDLEFHSMGADYGSTEVLNQALVTALRQVMAGANYQLGHATWVDPENLEAFPVLVLPVTLVLVLPQALLPTAAGVAIDNAVYQTTIVNQVGLDTSGQVDGQHNTVAGSG